MTYEQAAAFVESTKKYGSILGLESIQNLMHRLGDVQEELHCVHIAGTNGKGSVCAFLSSALREAGYSVGRYNSPAVFERREVFRIGEEMISEKEYAEVMEEVQSACKSLVSEGKTHPTVFEVETAAAFLWFYKRKCDLVLLETGMGGESDATNLITKPLCSVLTSIDMDHMQFLGSSLSEIAAVKAGIIKKGCPVVALKQSNEVCDVIKKRAEESGSVCTFADAASCQKMSLTMDGISLENSDYGKISTTLCGAYQKENLILALTVLKQLEKSGYPLKKESVRVGIAKTVWQGRFEVLRQKPLFIIDGAHNPAAVRRLKETIEKNFTNREIIYIIGVLADKEHAKMMGTLLSKAKAVFTVTPDNPRALDGRILAEEARQYMERTVYVPKISDAVEMALKEAGHDDVIIAFGSLSYLKEIKNALQ